MKFPSIFGRSASARERPAGLKSLRRSGRPHRLNFRKQLRTFTCFSTEEKVSRCDSEEKQKRKRGLLSQRLRLTECSENQTRSLDVMSRLVMRPSTQGPPQGRHLPTVTEVQVCGDVHSREPSTEQEKLGKQRSSDRSPWSTPDGQDSSVTHGPSSLTVTSLNEEQLNAYLKLMFQQCKEERGQKEAAGSDLDKITKCNENDGAEEQDLVDNKDVNETEGSSTTEKAPDPCQLETESAEEKRTRALLFREKCLELIRRHEEKFGPIITERESDAPPEASERMQPAANQILCDSSPELQVCEPCVSSAISDTYLTIPQDMDRDKDADLDEWRRYYNSGPDGVWKIVTSDRQNSEVTRSVESDGKEQRSRGVFGVLRGKCSALFRIEDEEEAQTYKNLGDNIFAPAGTYAKISDGSDLVSRTISETSADEVLTEMKDDEIELCTNHQHIMPTFKKECNDPDSYQDNDYEDWRRAYKIDETENIVNEIELCTTYQCVSPVAEIPCHDPELYKEDTYRDWKGFFRRMTGGKSSHQEPPVETALLTRPRGVVQQLTSSVVRDLTAHDWLPASCWWGVSPLLEAMLHVLPSASSGTQTRPGALLQLLSPLSSQMHDVGLQRLVIDLSHPDDRQVAWLTQPDLPRLFVCAGFGPEEMTRWLMEVPQDIEDDEVIIRELPVDVPDVKRVSLSNEGNKSKCFAKEKEILEPDACSQEETPEGTKDETSPHPPVIDAAHECEPKEVILQETDTSAIETPYTQFGAGWTHGVTDDETGDIKYSVSLQNIIASRLNVHAKEFRPLCSDPCTFVSSQSIDKERGIAAERIASESDAAYDTYETKQWWIQNDTGEELSSSPRSVPTPYSLSPPGGPDPVSKYDSETDIGEHLSQILKEHKAAVFGTDSNIHLRNSSVRPIDSEVDIAQVLHEQSGYMNFAESRQPSMTTAYQSLPLEEVDSETEIGLALPLTDSPRVLDERSHRGVRVYDSETEMGELITSLHGVDSETEIGQHLEKLETWPWQPSPQTIEDPVCDVKECDSEIGMGGSDYPTPFPDRREVVGSSSMSRLPAAPVQVDSETEMGVVLNMFGQGLLPSRYFAGVELPEDAGAEITRLASSDSDINILIPGSHEDDEVQIISKSSTPTRSTETQVQVNSIDYASKDNPAVSLVQSLDNMYDTSKRLSKSIIRKALLLLEETAARYPVARKESSAFGTTGELEGIEVESDGVPTAATTSQSEQGACNPEKVIPEVNVTTSDGSFVILFPSQPAEHADFYETEERLVLKMVRPSPAQDQTEVKSMTTESSSPVQDQIAMNSAVVESRGFQPTVEAGVSLSEQELWRRRMAGRCAEAALRRQRSPSPRQHASEESGLRVLYRAESAEPWNPVSPEGLSGLALAQVDPELANVKWMKNSRGEDGEPEPCFGGEGEVPPLPPNESRSQTELSKAKPATPTPMGANSWC